MYTASQYEFRSFPDIRRNSPNPTLRTEEAPTQWLQGWSAAAHFISKIFHPTPSTLPYVWISQVILG